LHRFKDIAVFVMGSFILPHPVYKSTLSIYYLSIYHAPLSTNICPKALDRHSCVA